MALWKALCATLRLCVLLCGSFRGSVCGSQAHSLACLALLALLARCLTRLSGSGFLAQAFWFLLFGSRAVWLCRSHRGSLALGLKLSVLGSAGLWVCESLTFRLSQSGSSGSCSQVLWLSVAIWLSGARRLSGFHTLALGL
jgi:hypothetical protein